MAEFNLLPISSSILFLGIFIVLLSVLLSLFSSNYKKLIKYLHLVRHRDNPILSPEIYSEWESQGTFNPAAITDDHGNVHIVYRAIGGDGVSRLGYIASSDGFAVTDKSPYPIFTMQNPRYGIKEENKRFDPVMYASGGSWGGAEDPRMVRIDGRVYVTYSAFDGWDYIRMAVMSVDEKDFFNKKWKWSKPLLISPQNQLAKNWVLFPEKVNGKFALLHSLFPNVSINYVDRLEDLAHGLKNIKSSGNHGGYGYLDKTRKDHWDYRVKGVGPPPIKTDKGWLVLYHAIHESQYKLGALLLDLNDPTKVIRRSPAPILFSNEWYEHDWKPGVVYACGAVVKADNLLVYYGGGDKHVCVAHTPLNSLLDWLIEYGKI